MKHLILFFLLTISLLFSCKKDNAVTSNASLIIGRWSLSPTTYQLYTDRTLSSTSAEQYDVSDYAEFKQDGTFQTEANGGPFIYRYKLESDSLIFDNTKKAKITILTSSNLSYFFTDSINPRQYRITTFNFKK